MRREDAAARWEVDERERLKPAGEWGESGRLPRWSWGREVAGGAEQPRRGVRLRLERR
jgi:hypothetical protein